MGRKSFFEVCKICGRQARKINYHSKAKGKLYYYYKYVHKDGTVHYFRINTNDQQFQLSAKPKLPIHDAIEEVVNIKGPDQKLRFSEIRSLIAELYNDSYSSAVIYRGIQRLIKLNIMEKVIINNQVFYKKKSSDRQSSTLRVIRMSIGLVLSKDNLSVTIFAYLKNTGIGISTGFNISVPFTWSVSSNKYKIEAFDDVGMVPLNEKNVLFAAPDQSIITIPFNHPLRMSEEKALFITFSSEYTGNPFKMTITTDIEILKIRCKLFKGNELVINRLLLDGLKKIEPVISRRTALNPEYSILEASFEDLSVGDTVSILPQSKHV
ncbi:MAG: hypothetical protein QXU18_13080 [Thermoplasmatales archaeon]